MFFVVTSATGVTSALVTFHPTTNWLCRQIWFSEKIHQRRCPKILDEGNNYCVIFLGKHAWETCGEWFTNDVILNHQNIPHSHGCCIRNNQHFTSERDFFYSHWMLVWHFFRETSNTTIKDSERGTLLHVGKLSKKKEEEIDELSENADDLLLESDLLESILEIAISTVEHLVQMWLLEPQRRPHPLLSALLALGNALEAISEKEKADREQDERAGMKEA